MAFIYYSESSRLESAWTVHLYRHRPVQLRFLGLVNDLYAPATELFENLVLG